MESRIPDYVWELMILPRLGLKDIIRFAAVCHSWKSMASTNLHRLNRIPWMMLYRDEMTNTVTFFSLSESTLYQLKLPPSLSRIGAFCSGSSQGYLIMAGYEGDVLFNPFSQSLVHLPKPYTTQEDDFAVWSHSYFHRTTLSMMSNTSQYLVSATCSNSRVIQMCKPDDPEWAVFGVVKVEQKYDTGSGLTIDDEEEEEQEEEEENEATNNDLLFSDLVWYKGVLHGLTESNGLVTFDFHDYIKPPGCSVLNILPMDTPAHDKSEHIFRYLVESQGELLLVYRFAVFFRDEKYVINYVTKRFLVFKLDRCRDPLRWIQVENLDDEMLFVGKNTSLSVPAKGLSRFKGNCIYFTSDTMRNAFNSDWYTDNGVLYIEDGRIESFPIVDDFLSSTFKFVRRVTPNMKPTAPGWAEEFTATAPVWVTPDVVL